MTVIIDVQGFIDYGNSFIVKELAALNLVTGKFHQYIFQEPRTLTPADIKFFDQIRWVTTFHHGLPWCGGDTPYCQLKHTILHVCEQATDVLVKGSEKANFIRTLVGPDINVTDLTTFQCPALNVVRPRTNYCKIPQHKNSQYTCAVANVSWLSSWYNRERNKGGV
ncbi:hypothetical protein B566_EDAN016801 [Ephemera danica]|nr:hypothetical protein B566_EDAN016801 [Ephemera danica]